MANDPDSNAPTLTAADERADSLLARMAGGDRAAFAELYDAIAPRVLGLIQRVLVDRAQSEEVAQEVFLEVWQTAARFERGRGGARGWVLTIAHRRAIDRVRAAQASKERDLRIGIRDRPVEVDVVSEAVELKLAGAELLGAMERLSESQREAITLAYYGGLSQSELAAHLGVPLGTVKTRIRDGMIRLRNELGVRS